jgi:dTDP-glucose 4,6-dehydratase
MQSQMTRSQPAHENAQRRAVVTGGAGFLGSHLCEALLDRGYHVLCLDNLLTSAPVNVAHLMGRRSFRLIRCDVVEFIQVPGPVDRVLHFASPASPIDYLQFPIHTLQVGSVGTSHALGLAKEKGARFVLASTSEIYVDPMVHPQREDYWGNVDPVGPRGVHVEAKRFAEALTTAYRTTHGVNTGIVRIFNTYGPRMRPFDGRAIPTFIRQTPAGEPLTVSGTGAQTRSICHVSDLLAGILAMPAPAHSGPINIGNPNELSVRQIAQDVIATTGSSSTIEFFDRPVDDPEVRRPNTTLAAAALGWHPAVNSSQGLVRTVDWFTRALSRLEDSLGGLRANSTSRYESNRVGYAEE